MAVLFNGQVYLFEFKVVEESPAGKALQQLRDMGYADKYRAKGCPIHLIGVEFSKADRNIVGFEVNQTPNRLSSEIIKQIEQADIVAISAISCFEVAWLADHKRILLEIPVQEWIAQATDGASIICLPVSCKIASLAAEFSYEKKFKGPY